MPHRLHENFRGSGNRTGSGAETRPEMKKFLEINRAEERLRKINEAIEKLVAEKEELEKLLKGNNEKVVNE
jgi:hypothetical protein